MEIFLTAIKRIIPKKIFQFLQPPYHFFLSWLAAFFYRWPSKRLIVIGVTGTTGKTTTAYILTRLLKESGFKAGLTSTSFWDDGEKEVLNNKKITMAGRFFTQKMLLRMAKNGCQFAVIETTSEGIRQFRHRFINYDWLIFTGLYSEHLEAHGGFSNYKKAKGELFAHLKRCSTKYADDYFRLERPKSSLKKIELNRVKKTIAANLDDKEAGYFLSFWAERKIGYSQRKNLDKTKEGWPDNLEIFNYGKIAAYREGFNFYFNGADFKLNLLGEFNIQNAAAAISLAQAAVKDSNKIKEALSKIRGVAGRMEKIEEGQPFQIIVDYAFEPKALASLYETVEALPHRRIIQVLGSAGGGRDKERRPQLGELAGAKADYVIVANEDPYDEDPQKIIDEVSAGALNKGKELNADLFKILDRREAIAKALALAREEDLILITGKGCEQAICAANGRKIPWDDRRVAREELQRLSLN